ncbi:MAG: 6-carboxytetrahydropterin synthase QueD [Spirochaetaceae bacterium]|jgi:6-pyruvoyltetrahydropterin/6-carboxytetrahydropterin synthase|nr:6-carboxytetrahydropterin synthase QueD [Spirochaetaceae bacterium]
MYHVRVESDFAAAHFLSGYRGNCEKLHGHNYRVRLWARGGSLDGSGMLADFTVLKGTLRKVCAALDHSNLNDNPVFENSPSAERIARYIFDQVVQSLPEMEAKLINAVEVYETPVTMARYERN